MKILIAEDDPISAMLLRKTLEKNGYQVVATGDGLQALEALRGREFDAILTDWMMPNMDGISLVRRVRAELESPPPILVVTALSSGDAQQHALEAGADDYLAKPYEADEILRRLESCINRSRQPAPRVEATVAVAPATQARSLIPHVGVGIGASTGGPEALRDLLPQLHASAAAAYMLVMHGPDWMLQTFAERARGLTSIRVQVASDGQRVRVGELYVCPGDVHMIVEPGGPTLRLSDAPPQNFVRPAIDPTLRSLASVYGPRSVAIIMTGMGRDGSLGAQAVHAAGGTVIVQDPATAVAPSMPRTTVGIGAADHICPLDDIAGSLRQAIDTRLRAQPRVGV